MPGDCQKSSRREVTRLHAVLAASVRRMAPSGRGGRRVGSGRGGARAVTNTSRVALAGVAAANSGRRVTVSKVQSRHGRLDDSVLVRDRAGADLFFGSPSTEDARAKRRRRRSSISGASSSEYIEEFEDNDGDSDGDEFDYSGSDSDSSVEPSEPRQSFAARCQSRLDYESVCDDENDVAGEDGDEEDDEGGVDFDKDVGFDDFLPPHFRRTGYLSRDECDLLRRLYYMLTHATEVPLATFGSARSRSAKEFRRQLCETLQGSGSKFRGLYASSLFLTACNACTAALQE